MRQGDGTHDTLRLVLDVLALESGRLPCRVAAARPFREIVGNWDEWFQHEASHAERDAIEHIGRNEGAQREFVRWISTTWVGEVVRDGNASAAEFVLRQLAAIRPFIRWSALAEYRTADEKGRISAVVLADASTGHGSDVRPVGAVVLPSESGAPLGAIATSGFHADWADLGAARDSVISTLRGGGLFRLLVKWSATGRLLYPLGIKFALSLGWAGVAALVAYLLFGPEPAEKLPWLAGALFALWSVLLFTWIAGIGIQTHAARRAGRALAAKLERGDLRLSMDGSLTLKGGSAGLAFSLAMFSAVDRAYPDAAKESWLWRRFFTRLNADASRCAATGVVMPDGEIKPVVIDGKLRACLAQSRIEQMIVPSQAGATERVLDAIMGETPMLTPAPMASAAPLASIGHARAARRLRVSRCGHLADAVLQLGALRSRWQMALNIVAVGLSGVMLAAISDVRCILFPPPPPMPIPPASPSPYFLWISVETKHPEFFQVVFESPAWAYRTAEIAPRNSAPASVRAEIRLVRMRRVDVGDLEQGTVWIERRPCFLTRKYEPSERVGKYSFAYLARLGHD